MSAFIPERLLAYITFCVVTALEYLHQELKVIHRDVKPSNILIDRYGHVKVCDFGISGNLVNSLAITNVGSQSYLAPERISSDPNIPGYSIRSDVWSLGLSVLELANCRFPYLHRSSLYDQIVNVVERPPPSLSEDSIYSQTVRDFISKCLVKEVRYRASYIELLEHDMLTPFKCETYLQESLEGFAHYVIQILRL